MRPMRVGFLVIVALGVVVASGLASAQPAKPRRVGVLLASTAAPGVAVEPWLVELGYREGDDLAYERRFAAGRDDRLPELAADLTRRRVDLILAVGLPAIRAAKQATGTIPVVMIAEGDPVRAGLVASLARPGGNLTGVTVLGPELGAKRLELLREVVPGLRRAAVLWNPADPEKAEEWKVTEAAARVPSRAAKTTPPEAAYRAPVSSRRAWAAPAASARLFRSHMYRGDQPKPQSAVLSVLLHAPPPPSNG